MEKYGFVYIWRDRKHKRYYIGSHWGTEDDGRISLVAPDETGSRNYLYNEQTRLDRNRFYSENGISKILYRIIPTNSVMHRFIKYRANAGYYSIIEETPRGDVTDIKVALNL